MLKKFDRELLRRTLTLAMEGIGILLLLAGLVILAAGVHLDWEFCKIAGTAIVSSGVFSAVASSRFFTKIFTSVIHDVVFGREYLSSRNDLETVWKRVSDALCEQRFPNLKDKIDQTIMDDYLPKTREFYYSNVVRHFTVLELSKSRDTITCEDNSELTLVPHAKAQYIEYKHKFKPSGGKKNIVDETFKIDGIPINDFPDEDILEQRKEGDFSVIVVKLTAEEHKISRRRTTVIPLCPEPYSKVTYNTYAEHVRLNASSKVDEVHIKLVDKDLFTNTDNNAEIENRVSAENTKLIMPGQSHMLLYSISNPA